MLASVPRPIGLGFAATLVARADRLRPSNARDRTGTDGGIGMKLSDRWRISLCKDCHTRQHAMGEATFEKSYGINMKALAGEFFRNSKHRHKLEVANDG